MKLSSVSRTFGLTAICVLLGVIVWMTLREAPSRSGGVGPTGDHLDVLRGQPTLRDASGPESPDANDRAGRRDVQEHGESGQLSGVAAAVQDPEVVVRGRVRGADQGALISGATITLGSRSRSAQPGFTATGRSDDNGAFELRYVPADGDMLLSATAAGYAASVMTVDPRSTEVLDLWLQPIQELRLVVIVTDESGIPVPHLDFVLRNPERIVHSWRSLHEADGKFELSLQTRFRNVDVPQEGPDGWLEASSAEFGTQRIAPIPRRHLVDGATIRATLESPRRWPGLVLSPDGQPLPDAVLAHRSAAGAGVFAPSPVVDGEGRFELLFSESHPAGVLRVTHADFPAKELDLSLERTDTDLIVTLGPGIELEGIVTVPAGQRPDRYHVRIIDSTDSFLGGNRARIVPVELSGYFQARGLAARTLLVEVIELRAGDRAASVGVRRAVHPAASGRTWVELEVERPATLTGTASVPAIHGNGATRVRIGLFPASSATKPYDRQRDWVDALGAVEAYEGRPFELAYTTEQTTWPLVALLRLEMNADAAIERLVELQANNASIGTLTVPAWGMLEFQGDPSKLPEGSVERRIRDDARRSPPKLVATANR